MEARSHDRASLRRRLLARGSARFLCVCAALLAVAAALPATAAAFPPLANTEAATGVGQHEATLHGLVNPLGMETTYYFEYGTSTEYGSKTSEMGAGSGFENFAASETVTELDAWTTYHFRIVATNGSGTTKGEDETFATPPEEFWSLLSTPNPKEATTAYLKSVECLSSSECIAVGDSNAETLAASWDGSEWTLMSTPNVGASINELVSVSCTTFEACTAVGVYWASGAPHPLVERWDGSEWEVQEAPDPSGAQRAQFRGVSCSSATACTAVGWYRDEEGSDLTLAERWNGSEWTIQSTPNAEGFGSFFNEVSCASNSACMAVGHNGGASLAASWDGSEWELLTTPKGGSGLADVVCRAASECTAVGSTTGAVSTLAERWNGSSWQIQETPNPSGSERNQLEGVSCPTSSVCYGVGWSEDESENATTLVERWDGSEWEIEYTPNPAEASVAAFLSTSCASASACMATGTARFNAFDITTLSAERSE